MSQPPQINLRGAVDLSGLRAPRPAPGAEGADAAIADGGVVVEVSEATFGDLIQRSTDVPVVVDLWSGRAEASAQLSALLRQLATAYGGRFLLARVEVDANPQIAQAFQVQAIPSVVAIIKGQPVPLFQGAYPEAQVRQVLDELLRVAAENGVTGRVDVGEEPAEEEPEPAEPELPPLHAAAYDAIERGDLDAAAQAYRDALAENPADADAKAGLGQVELMARVGDADPASVLAAADAAPPTDVDAHLAAADVEFGAGRAEAAFDRLIAVVRATSEADRDRARTRLLDLFALTDPAAPELQRARRALASALF
ncbi:Thioredoxin domain protein [Beutenbergia cavernae DSM 12333]|uniref:Thioredoxin domain protein n=1 Tax=Beutenbergia cavernae (strain ATCC BAA-8 / DSM 12333 / CCUG 43141 / JCM 11478 / NBRC 16432 / NCIMB 13614 / HKI 0122) TaxID=471853 RepID=C5C1X4_BEUC1|nr:tetratricopeptide repeat protein [Beutenbergia cavernae]ACQ79592.1 Thioredoxin domain protein [Beutenbergia cavernae DSM 12333]